MSEIDISLEQLRSMIGTRVGYQGESYEIVEILEDGPSIVLQGVTLGSVIQGSLYGDASRRVPQTVTIPVLSLDRQQLGAEFLALDLLEAGE